jgi:cell division protein FtsI (penicillin-binding protein 3)
MAKAKRTKTNTRPVAIHWRFYTALGIVCLVFCALMARAAYIQVIAPDRLIREGDNRTVRTLPRAVQRGLIYDRNGVELAVSIPVKSIYADPKVVHERNALQDMRRWEALAEALETDTEKLLQRVQNPKRRFVYLQRQVPESIAEFVKQLDIGGVYLESESRRFYPTGEVSAHVIGFTNIDDQGLEGLEKLYNDTLTGSPGKRKIRKDAKGRQIEVLHEQQAEPPDNLHLSIDQRIQTLAYRELKTQVQYLNASSGSVVIADVETGEILALVNSPSYNPNNRKGVQAHRFRNRAITDTFEPGSTVKPLAVISALDFGEMTADHVLDVRPMHVGGRRIAGTIGDNELDLAGILRRSNNVGTTKLALSVPANHFVDLFYNVGFGNDTGTGLIGESMGLFAERRRWSDSALASLSYGYGIAVTTAQLAQMYSIIGNGGVKRPLSIFKQQQPLEGERVISEKTAKQVLAMLETVTQKGGTAPKAAVAGYRVAGKTGTSQKAIAGGYGDDYVNCFAGVAPVSNPKIAVAVMIDDPAGDLYHGGETAAPLFSKIVGGTLQLLNVAPDALPTTQLARSDKNSEGANDV